MRAPNMLSYYIILIKLDAIYYYFVLWTTTYEPMDAHADIVRHARIYEHF